MVRHAVYHMNVAAVWAQKGGFSEGNNTVLTQWLIHIFLLITDFLNISAVSGGVSQPIVLIEW